MIYEYHKYEALSLISMQGAKALKRDTNPDVTSK